MHCEQKLADNPLMKRNAETTLPTVKHRQTDERTDTPTDDTNTMCFRHRPPLAETQQDEIVL